MAPLDDGATKSKTRWTDSLRSQLDEATRAQARPVGQYQLAGLDSPTSVYWWPSRA